MVRLVIQCLLLAQIVYGLPRLYRGKYVHEETSKKSTDKTESNKRYEFFFTQKLDHFDRQLETTFKQRYFINDTYWKGEENAPVFLCVGGEGPPLDRTVLVSSVHCNDMVELAPKYNALMVALEHRYYGPSNPFGSNFSTPNLKWLNSEQALEDIAAFHSHISTEYNLKSSNKWVSFGGSYPGMMAGLSRLRFPNLIHAAVASSAPLEAVVDMVGYNNVVAQSMASTIVGGSPQCLAAIQEGHEQIGKELESEEGRRMLEKTFNVCTPGSLDEKKNQEQFAGDGVVYFPVQSNDPSCTTQYCNIASICVLMTDSSVGSPLERLASLSNAQQGGACVSASYDGMLAVLSSAKNPERSWLYQTCTEWGFYQTCNVGSKCPYTQGLHTIEADYDICKTAFGIDAESVNMEINRALARYGGDQIQGSRIMFPNGQIDPWHANSVLKSPKPQEPAFWVEGASHHFWTHPSLPTDSSYVVEARQRIWQQVGDWLEEP